jgi:glycine hydroxymethyltransferase
MGMGLPSGGHLTHGWKVSISGKYFNAIQYGVRRDDHLIDFDEVASLAREHKPKLLWCGATAYPRVIDFAKFAEIAQEVGAILVADIAHISGLVAGGAHPSPVGHAEVISSTTAIDRAVFPGLQGGPHNGTTAGIAIAAKLASTDEFKAYAKAIVDNSRVLAETLLSRGFDLVTGGSDNHLILIDLTGKDVPGKVAAQALDRAGMVANYNSVPFDTRKPFDPSGVRLGTPAITSRGMGAGEMKRLGNWMADVVDDVENEALISKIAGEVKDLCDQFPAPGVPVR